MSVTNPKQEQNSAKDVAGRENKGMAGADMLAGAKDKVNQALGGDNKKSTGQADNTDHKGESLPGADIPGKNY